MIDLQAPATHAAVAEVVGVSRQAISALIEEGKLSADGSVLDVVRMYRTRLREVAAGRLGAEVGGLDLVQERAALAREQRIAQELKNAIARREYAPIGLITDVLAEAGGAVVDQMDQFEGMLRKACPAVPDDVKEVVMTVMGNARNAWIRGTSIRVDAYVDESQRLAVDDVEDSAATEDQEE